MNIKQKFRDILEDGLVMTYGVKTSDCFLCLCDENMSSAVGVHVLDEIRVARAIALVDGIVDDDLGLAEENRRWLTIGC